MQKEKVIRTVLEMQALNIWQIVISGGEPFLHPEIMTILKSILEHEVDLALTTNGTVLSESQIEHLWSLQQEFPDRLNIQVSVDGPSVEINNILRGKGERLFFNVESMFKVGIQFGIGTVLHRYNADCVREILEVFYPVVTNFHFIGLMPSHSVAKNVTELYPTPKQMQVAYTSIEAFRQTHPDLAISFPMPLSSTSERLKSSICCDGCTAAVTRMDINAEGEVLACHIADESVMGNIYEQSLLDIWRSSRSQKYRHSSRPLCRRFEFIA